VVYSINVVLINAKSVYFSYCVGGYSCFNMYANTADMAVGNILVYTHTCQF